MRIKDCVLCDLAPKKLPTFKRCKQVLDIVLGNAPMDSITLLVKQDDNPLLGERTVDDSSDTTRRNEFPCIGLLQVR